MNGIQGEVFDVIKLAFLHAIAPKSACRQTVERDRSLTSKFITVREVEAPEGVLRYLLVKVRILERLVGDGVPQCGEKALPPCFGDSCARKGWVISESEVVNKTSGGNNVLNVPTRLL